MPISIPERALPALLLCAGAAVLLSACARETASPRPDGAARATSTLHPVRVSSMSEAERKYGMAPTLNDEVTYQPDVVVVENGAAAIRGLSEDGLTWRVDADAVPDIEVGKVVFLTSRAVGRVLQITREGGELALLLGPIELTDLIRDCNLAMDGPADFGQALTYSLPEMPAQTTPFDAIARSSGAPAPMTVSNVAGDGAARTLLWSPDAPSPRRLLAQTGRIEPFTTNSISDPDGLGVVLSKTQNGVHIEGHAKLKVQTPRLTIHIIISKGEVMVAKLTVSGMAGLNIGFAAVNTVGRDGNINERYIVPADKSIPLGGPFPLTITIRQQFIVQTKFGSTGTLTAIGDFGFGGSLGVGYSKPDWTVFAPASVTGLHSLQDSVDGSMLNVGAVSFTHQVKVIGGIGGFNFVVGPYVFLNSNINVTRHADVDAMARCIYSGFNLRAGTGVGYVIPQPLVSFINALLRTLNLQEIKGDGGLEGDKKLLVNATEVRPRSDWCEHRAPPPPTD